MNLILTYHRWVAEALLFVMLLNLLLPYVLRQNSERMIFWTRVGYFAFWAFWTMVAFGGLITWIFKLQAWPMTVIAMVGVAAVLMPIDIYRALTLKKIWMNGRDGVGFNALWVGIEIVLAAGTIAYAMIAK